MKYPFSPTLFALLCATVSAAPVTYAQPQESDAARWYRVELMIFSRPDEAASRAEIWDPEPGLEYPDAFRYLIDPATVAANLEANPGESSVDPLGVQTILLPVEIPPEEETPDIPLMEDAIDSEQEAMPAEELEELVQDPNVPDPNVPDPNSQAMELDPALLESEELEQEPLTPSPFTTRPLSELEFRGKAAYMQRTGRFRTLFHQTWLQPMTGAEETLPIIVDRSGDLQDWPLLQGSVKLYVSRYLHLETNLWINTQGQYFTENWRIPAPPLSPASLILVTPPPLEFGMDPNNPLSMGELTDGVAANSNEVKTETGSPMSTVSVDQSEDVLGIDAGALDAMEVDGLEPEELEPEYPWRHAVLMQQKRRMRSNEVHYLDHPMLGVVIKLTPLSAEELEEIVLIEQAAAAEMAAAEEAAAQLTE